MTDTTTAARDLQGEILKTVNQSQEAVLGAIREWTQAVHSLTPKLPVNLPFADKLPNPEELLAGAYDFAQQLLASQRKFAVEIVRATSPLMPVTEEAPDRPSDGAKNGAVAK
jgi:hypothetical protein